jgi:lysophospholipase L1-like esterase
MLPVAIRVDVPDDGAAHNIDIATVNAQGFQYCGWGVETPRPQLWCTVARPLDAAYSVDGDGDAKVALMNAVLDRVAAEFGYCMVADIDGALGKTAANFGDNIHPNATGHAIVADTILERIATLGVPASVRRFL